MTLAKHDRALLEAIKRERDELIDRCKALRTRCIDLISKSQQPEPCDVCAGDPSSVEGECVCNGTGLMSEAVIHMRTLIAALRVQLEAAEVALHEARSSIAAELVVKAASFE